MEKCENSEDSISQEPKPQPDTAVEPDSIGTTNVKHSFPKEIKEYLKQISSDVDRSTNPKLRKEHQRLTDLLSSYNKLTDRLNKEVAAQSCNKCVKTSSQPKCDLRPKEISPVLPEIYAALRPDLYKDVREEEKKRLISKFTNKRIYSQAERVLPPHTAPHSYALQDRRQNEKDRFCKLVSSAPSRFHNPVGSAFTNISSKPFKTLKTVASFKVDNVREKEKDRLAKIFASGAARNLKYVRKSNPTQRYSDTFQNIDEDDTLRLNGTECVEEADMCRAELACNQENINPQNNMVRVGEYSPLNGHHRGKTVLGVGEHEEQQKQLNEERRNEYKTMMAKQKIHDHEMATFNHKKDENHFKRNPRMSSASTQTDSEESSTSFQDNTREEFDSPINSTASSPHRRRPMEFSPREKLLLDLYGSPPITHYQAAQNEKDKQAAYAEALRAQIEEKRRLEEEKKRREKEEEELIERRVREQAERLRIEYLKEQNQKSDWMMQRQAQEEALRRRLLELELESRELKKQERQKKLKNNDEIDYNQQKSTRKPLQKRHYPQPYQSEESSMRSNDNKSGFSTTARNTFPKSPILEVAPLLDSDRQNVLSVMANELSRGPSNLNEEAAALVLGPGVNLLSPKYVGGDDGSFSLVNNSGSTLLTKEGRDIANVPLEGYVPTVGQISPRSVSQQPWTSDVERNHSQRLFATKQTHRPPPITMPENYHQGSSRPGSPVVPALQTDMLLKRNSKILDDKWKVPPKHNYELERTAIIEPLNKKESTPNRSILTQLGEFRRKLAKEHQLLELRLKQSNS